MTMVPKSQLIDDGNSVLDIDSGFSGGTLSDIRGMPYISVQHLNPFSATILLIANFASSLRSKDVLHVFMPISAYEVLSEWQSLYLPEFNFPQHTVQTSRQENLCFSARNFFHITHFLLCIWSIHHSYFLKFIVTGMVSSMTARK